MESKKNAIADIKLKSKIEELEVLNNLLEKKQLEKQKEEFIASINEKIENITKDDLISELNHYMSYYKNYIGKNSLINSLLRLNLEEELLKLCNEKIYEYIINFFKEEIENITNENIIEIIEQVVRLKIISEKDKTKYLVNNGLLDNVIIFSKEKIDEMKKELITFFDTVIKYDLLLINIEEFRNITSSIYYKILRCEEIRIVSQVYIFSEENISKLSFSKDNTEKIKQKNKDWTDKSERMKKIKTKFISKEEDYSITTVIECAYLFNKEELTNYKSRILIEIENEIEKLNKSIKSENIKYTRIRKKINELKTKYEKLEELNKKL